MSRQHPFLTTSLLASVLAGTALAQSPLPCPLQPADSPFAVTVWAFTPAPGQFVNNPAFNNPCRALGAPIGGGTAGPDNSKLVSLGGFSGSITLGFNRPIRDDPRNRFGVDAIVFSNAFWVGGNPNRRFAEPASIEVSRDTNANGLPDDPWYLIPGSHLALPPAPPAPTSTQTWDDNIADTTFPPLNPTWVPPGRSGQWATSAFRLPAAIFETGPILANPNGPQAVAEGVWGYADHTPTLVLGDTDADNVADDPAAAPESFYTLPDDPFAVGITPGAAGGDGFDIAWAVDPATLTPANLPSIDFLRITTAVNLITFFGEASPEIGGVADVRPALLADWNADGIVNAVDVSLYLNAWFESQLSGSLIPDIDENGITNAADVSAFFNAWFVEQVQ